ncbi:uncharacterized protein N7473_008221 [Penicillium subrubescens]|uniref:Seipin n=1 Tax=Penicillium subrubescens TaxID=1316194 RepID=A0A1Q5TKK8_9EURO|nr:uncharacterized protein N7473_008221 [Penicillium subrubescens]KAJ5891993.1 hypothetical protein N7473_008221 [Penicillium subrubescens]OKP00763.1 Seipin [Penicillium subrubescens]
MAESEYSDDETEYGSPSHSQAVIMDALLTPFRALVSKTALRIYLNIILFSGATLLLLGISGIAYAIFYFRFIPTVGVGREIHLQFGDLNPWGIATFDSEFVSSQPYDVAVALDLPRTPTNLDVGNFMIDLTLYSPETASVLPTTANSQNKISHSRRPAILTYTSPLVDFARKLVRLPLYVVGWRREAETLEVSMMEKVEFARGSRNRPQSLRLEIQSEKKMQVYSARVEFRARFTGLRWFMYRWKLTFFMVFSSLFWTVSMASASLTWFILTWIMQAEKPEAAIKEEEDIPEAIKEEPEDSSSSSDSVKIKKEEPETKSSFLQSYPAEGDYPGLGSGRESAEARGVQKRKSHTTEGDH